MRSLQDGVASPPKEGRAGKAQRKHLVRLERGRGPGTSSGRLSKLLWPDLSFEEFIRIILPHTDEKLILWMEMRHSLITSKEG